MSTLATSRLALIARDPRKISILSISNQDLISSALMHETRLSRVFDNVPAPHADGKFFFFVVLPSLGKWPVDQILEPPAFLQLAPGE
jgi:hypothetical protein